MPTASTPSRGLKLVKTVGAAGRKSGVKVASPAELVAKLKDAGVIG